MKKIIGISAILVSLMMVLAMTASAESDSSRINRERKAIGRQLIEVQSTNWPAVLQYYTQDIEYHDPIVDIQGLDVMAEFLGRLFESSPDLVTTIEDETCINGIYSAAWTMVGYFNGVPYTAAGMSIIKFRPRETQAYYQRDYYTEGDIMINIPGLDEAVEGFRVYYRCAVDPTFDCPLDPPEAGGPSEETMSGVEDSPIATPYKLQQNVPNPFNPSTSISFEMPDGGGQVALRIYDVSGRLVRTLIDGYEPAGTSEVNWNGQDDHGQSMASGIYYYQMTGPSFSDMKKMVLLR